MVSVRSAVSILGISLQLGMAAIIDSGSPPVMTRAMQVRDSVPDLNVSVSCTAEIFECGTNSSNRVIAPKIYHIILSASTHSEVSGPASELRSPARNFSFHP